MLHSSVEYWKDFGATGFLQAVAGKLGGAQRVVQMSHRHLVHPFWLRLPSSDAGVFHQVLVEEEYAFITHNPPKVIIDAGADIGLAEKSSRPRLPGYRWWRPLS